MTTIYSERHGGQVRQAPTGMLMLTLIQTDLSDRMITIFLESGGGQVPHGSKAGKSRQGECVAEIRRGKR